MKRGLTDIIDVKRGTTQISKIMRGITLIWEKAGGGSYLLDTYPAAAAYSLSKLSGSYTGAAIRVRRSSDDVEQDIGFDGNDLDTTSLLNFVGAGDGYVTTWYDQSGNFQDGLQSSASLQPKIVLTGAVIMKDTKPALSFDVDFLTVPSSKNYFKFLHNGQYAISVVIETPDTDSLLSICGTGRGTSSSIGLSHFYDLRSGNTNFNAMISNRDLVGKIKSTTAIQNSTHYNTLTFVDMPAPVIGDRIKAWINGALIPEQNTENRSPSTADATYDFEIGGLGGNIFKCTGKYQELIIWNNDKIADAQIISDEVNNRYSIY